MTARRPAAGAAVAVVSGLLTLLAAEGLLRLVDRPRLVPSGWRAPGNVHPRNDLGYRGQPFRYGPGDRVVVLVGDSQVEALSLPFADMPEQVLQRELAARGVPARVFSLGSGGYGQDQELLALREYGRRHRLDLAVVWITPANDLWNNVFPTHGFTPDGPPKPTFWLEGDRLRGPSEGLLEPTHRWRLGALVSHVRPRPRDEAWETRLPVPYAPLSAWTGALADTLDPRLDGRGARWRWGNLANEKSPLATMLAPRSPRALYAIALARALLQEIAAEARRRGGRVLLLTAEPPYGAMADLSVARLRAEGPDRVVRFDGRYYRLSPAQHRETVRQLVAGFPHLAVPVITREWWVGPTDPHLNAAATAEVMGALAEPVAAHLGDSAPARR